jgi:hypothetical protein
MATTTNFGWETPDDTDLVKDGAAAIRTALGGVDTSFLDLKGGTTGQVLAKASATDLDFTWAADASGIPATIFDAKGDIIAATAADTAARLAVGANNTVLTADSTTATGLKWAAPAGAGANWTAVNAGGTTLTGGVSTVTISGITGADKLMIYFNTVTSASASSTFRIRFNTDSGGNYYSYGQNLNVPASYATTYQAEYNSNNTGVVMAVMGNTHFSTVSGYLMLSGGNAAGDKMYQGSAGISVENGTGGIGYNIGGRWNNSATITSVSIVSSTGNFDNGDFFVWKSA